jgi:hypothetical protein
MAKGRIVKGALDKLTERIDRSVKEAKDAKVIKGAKPKGAKPKGAKPKDDSAVTPGRRARVGNPTNIPKTGGNEQEVYQRNMSPAAVRAIDRNQRTGGPELSAGAGPSTPTANISMQGDRTRKTVAGLPARIKEAKLFQERAKMADATDAEKAAAKAMPKAIKRDMKRFGVIRDDDYPTPKTQKQAEKIIEAFQDLKESGLAKGGMPKKKKSYMGGGMAENKKSYMGGGMSKKQKSYMGGGMANGKKHSYVAGGYVTDMMGKKKK